MNKLEQPDGIIITISRKMLQEKGAKNWLKNFFDAMSKEDWTYYFRQGGRPKHDILYVYVNIGGKVRYRVNFVQTSTGHMRFNDGKEMTAKVWIVTTGPLVKAPYVITMQGFQGFRYTHKLF